MSDTNIEDFNGFEFEIDYKSVMDMYSDRCLNIVIEKSPKGKRKSNKYADGWVADAKDTKTGYEVEIKNKTNYQLTHLLENGHLIVNKRGGVGWSPAKPHIQASFDAIKNQYLNAMENVKVTIKG